MHMKACARDSVQAVQDASFAERYEHRQGGAATGCMSAHSDFTLASV
jgi:hypothetical protein